MARRDDQRHVAERTQVRREVGRRNRRNLDVELDVRRGLGRILERRLERLAPRVVGDHHPDAPDLTSLRELHDRLSNHGSSGQAGAERVAARLRQDLVVPRLHEEQRDLPFLGEPRRRQPDPAADDAPDRDDVLLLGQPPEAVDGRGRVRGLVVRDGEIELPPLPAPLHAARPVDLVHGQRRPGTHLKTPGREVRRERREHADLDRAPLGGPARPAVRTRPAQHGGEASLRRPRPQSICTASRPPSFRHACQRPGWLRRDVSSRRTGQSTPSRPRVLSIPLTTHTLRWLREPWKQLPAARRERREDIVRMYTTPALQRPACAMRRAACVRGLHTSAVGSPVVLR